MAINRGPFNALVDDDGTNTVGSVWNKNQIKTVLLDPIDAAILAGAVGTLTTTLTGTQNNLALAPGTTVVRCNNASLLTLTGIAAGYDGQLLDLVAVGAGQVDLAHQNSSSAAPNRIQNPVTGTISLAAGTARLRYDGTTGYWRVLAHQQGAGIAVPFLAGNFSAVGGSWTVTAGAIGTNRVTLLGKILHWTVYLTSTTIGGTPSQLTIAIPGGFMAAAAYSGIQRAAEVYDAGGAVEALVASSNVGGSFVSLQKVSNAAWVAGASPVVLFSLALEVV